MDDPRPRIWETVFLQFVGSQGVDQASEIAKAAIEEWDKKFQMIFKYNENRVSDSFPVLRDSIPEALNAAF